MLLFIIIALKTVKSNTYLTFIKKLFGASQIRVLMACCPDQGWKMAPKNLGF